MVEVKSRKEIEDAQRREHILLTAERLFAEQGFNSTSVGQIAREAEFGVGTLYKYFKDKTMILQELFKFRVWEEKQVVDPILWPETEKTAVEILDDIMVHKIDYMCEHRHFHMIYFSYLQPQMITPDFQGYDGFDELIQIHMKNRERMAQLYIEGIENGELADVEPAYYLSAVYGAMVSYFFMLTGQMGLHGNWPKDELIESIRTIFYDAILLKRPKE